MEDTCSKADVAKKVTIGHAKILDFLAVGGGTQNKKPACSGSDDGCYTASGLGNRRQDENVV